MDQMTTDIIMKHFMPAEGMKAYFTRKIRERGIIVYAKDASHTLRSLAKSALPVAEYGEIDAVIDECWRLIPQALADVLGDVHCWWTDDGDLMVTDMEEIRQHAAKAAQ